MNTERDKSLTEAMGECWHEMSRFGNCSKCKAHNYYQNDFSTWEGFGKLWGWAEKQEWARGWIFSYFGDSWKTGMTAGEFVWHQVNPGRFADAVYAYLKEA